jgi:Ser/Thr protein kinase RdoA (MazF antagonist)
MDKSTLAAINTKLNSDFKLVKQFGDGNSNKNFLLTDSKNKDIVVKQLENQPVEFVPVEVLIQKHLNKKGLSTPQIKNFDDENTQILKLGSKNLTHTDFIQSDESLPAPYELGVNIAKFQIAMKEFKHKLPPNWLHPIYWGNLKFETNDIELSEQIQKDLKEYRDTLTKLNLPKTIIHGDLNLGNVLTLNSKIIATLDLESTENNFRILDIGMTIFQVKPNYKISYYDLANEVIRGYESLISLTEQEKNQVLTATLYSASASGLWNLSFEGASKDFLESYTALINRIKDGFNT